MMRVRRLQRQSLQSQQTQASPHWQHWTPACRLLLPNRNGKDGVGNQSCCPPLKNAGLNTAGCLFVSHCNAPESNRKPLVPASVRKNQLSEAAPHPDLALSWSKAFAVGGDS
eukprot:1611998-Amphidinium_carterae.1